MPRNFFVFFLICACVTFAALPEGAQERAREDQGLGGVLIPAQIYGTHSVVCF